MEWVSWSALTQLEASAVHETVEKIVRGIVREQLHELDMGMYEDEVTRRTQSYLNMASLARDSKGNLCIRTLGNSVIYVK